ncbi:Transglutaminase-like superfamily protein [Filimonas lacunae]|uniref:Transglutaminase-like superfamily protein n=1 Tax=Filimonas lacunae TaxID=477680 RepID=A0A173MRF3_9BACT|nr:transglutaminase domain-containing protein [Filimonas lacunae]BAV09961.1 transglutaminase-like enzyme [Filimonas lacunae]SIS81738.1 Transglutaminase-like superfamily protein [Filimonas lacunae]
MKKPTLLLGCLWICATAFGQYQTSDGEGVLAASYLKKLDKKARFGASDIKKEITFSTGKGLNGQPVTTAEEKGVVEMVAMDNKVPMGYLIADNEFRKLDDYDFEIFYKTGFKSQKYPPEKVSLTDESIYLDDNFGLWYGFRAEESGQRSRFKFTSTFKDAKYLSRVFFHESFPVKSSTISFKVPDWLQLEITEKNFAGYTFKKGTKKEKGFTTYTYTADNLSGMKHEAHSLASPYYLPHLIITVRSFNINKKDYNGFKGPDDMYAWYNYLYKKADNQAESIKPVVQQLTQGKSTDEEKIKSIYYWVQDNIRYIAFEEGYAGFIPQTIQEVYKNKYGDCKGMANLLSAMLKEAGFDAHFSWIGTREIPYDRTEVQSVCVDNHAICVLYHNGSTYFLDGTEKYQPLGRNAYRIQGKKVLVEYGDTYKIETVPEARAGENTQYTTAALVLQEDKISGHVKVSFEGATSSLFHYIYNSIPTNRRKDFINSLLQFNNKNAEVTNIRTSDFKSRDSAIVIEGDVDLSEQVTVVENRYYTNIDFFPGTITRFIPEDSRKTPIDINEVYTSSDEITLELPANGKPISLPKSFTSEFLQNTMQASYTARDNKIILRKTMVINSPVINRSDFDNWKNFLNKIKAFNKSNLSVQL